MIKFNKIIYMIIINTIYKKVINKLKFRNNKRNNY